MYSSIVGKTVIVIGASKGIGKGIAKVFGSAKANVVVVGRNKDDTAKVVDEINNNDGCATYFLGDISNKRDMFDMSEYTAKEYGDIDILCCNAGIFPVTPLDKIDESEWDVVLATNLKGVLFAVQACLPYMKKNEQGRIILTSSITGPITGIPGLTHYGASKAGMLGFMRSAALELAKINITINAILPGNIYTEGLDGLGKEYFDTMIAAIPMGHLGKPEDIGHAALFFASDEAGFITGQTIVVDGGQVLPESLDAFK